MKNILVNAVLDGNVAELMGFGEGVYVCLYHISKFRNLGMQVENCTSKEGSKRSLSEEIQRNVHEHNCDK